MLHRPEKSSGLGRAFAVIALPVLMSVLTACAGTHDLPVLPDDPEKEPAATAPADGSQGAKAPEPPADTSRGTDDQILARYAYLDPQHLIDTNLLKTAVLYFDTHLASFSNQNYLSVIDFSKRSSEHRFFIIDLKTGAVWGIPVAHGSGSDLNADGYAERFSNAFGSNESSLGVYRVAETYYGTHGLSARYDGLSSTNSNVRGRAVVLHGSDYVHDAPVIQGRSWGCTAIPMPYRDKVVGMLKGGSMMYAGLSK